MAHRLPEKKEILSGPVKAKGRPAKDYSNMSATAPNLELTEAALEARQCVIFRLGQEAFAVEIAMVNEIIRMKDITPVPGALPHIRGLVNLRGQTIPVMDLRARIGLPEVEESGDSRIVVIDFEAGRLGIVVDAVEEVMTFEADAIQPASTLAAGKEQEFVEGVARQGERLVTLIDLQALVS